MFRTLVAALAVVVATLLPTNRTSGARRRTRIGTPGS